MEFPVDGANSNQKYMFTKPDAYATIILYEVSAYLVLFPGEDIAMVDAIEFRNVTYAYKRVPALDNLSFRIPENSIVGMIGANGAGKTTAIRLMIRYLQPDRGSILYKGQDIYSLLGKNHMLHGKWNCGNKKSRMQSGGGYPITYIPDLPVVFEELTVLEHLAFIGAMYHTEERIDDLTDLFELKAHLDKVPGILSKGTRQKLSIACALLREYEILLADEPFSGLDPKQISVLKERILEEKCKGKTVILSTHLLSLIESICDYYVLIDRGRLLCQGSLAELMELQGLSSLEKIYLQLSSQEVGETEETETED